jgi:hypothetical protein
MGRARNARTLLRVLNSLLLSSLLIKLLLLLMLLPWLLFNRKAIACRLILCRLHPLCWVLLWWVLLWWVLGVQMQRFSQVHAASHPVGAERPDLRSSGRVTSRLDSVPTQVALDMHGVMHWLLCAAGVVRGKIQTALSGCTSALTAVCLGSFP